MADTTAVGYVPVDKTGDTMTGDLTLSGTPTTDLMASTKKYVDDNTSLNATKALDNLASVAINTSLISDTDVTDDLGSLAVRWDNIYAAKLSSGDTAADVLTLAAYDVDGAVTANFITLTSNNTPTCVLATGVTGTTQVPGTNDTTLATTAYADAVGGGLAVGKMIALHMIL